MLNTSSGGPGSRAGLLVLANLEKRLAGRDPDDADIPAPVRTSVRLMLGGALVTALAGLFTVIVTLANPPLTSNGKQPTASQLSGDIIQVVLLTVVYCALWLLMARMSRSGRNWARIVASLLFAISTYSLYSAINSLRSGQFFDAVDIVSFILAIGEWVCGLGAIAMLWRAESSEYFKARMAK